MRLHTPVKSKKMRASVALVACVALLAVPGSAFAFADYPTTPSTAQAQGPQGSAPAGDSPASLPTPTVSTSPAVDDDADTVPIALAGVAFLVALGSVGFTVLSNTRMRRSLQPEA